VKWYDLDLIGCFTVALVVVFSVLMLAWR